MKLVYVALDKRRAKDIVISSHEVTVHKLLGFLVLFTAVHLLWLGKAGGKLQHNTTRHRKTTGTSAGQSFLARQTISFFLLTLIGHHRRHLFDFCDNGLLLAVGGEYLKKPRFNFRWAI
jgi:hypothetical protein